MAKNKTDIYTNASFSLMNRIARVIWNITYLFLFRPSPRPFHSWRLIILRIFGAKIGQGVRIYPKVKIWAPWNLIIEEEVAVADSAILYNQGEIHLGYRSIISQGAHLCASTHDYTLRNHPLITSFIIIKPHAWIAADAFIGPGVVVGEGAVVGARSAVFKEVKPWTVVGGNPAKFIKERVLI